MKYRAVGCLIVAACLLCGTASLAGPFGVSADRQLRVDWNGNPLITADQIDCIGPNTFQSPEGYRSQSVDGRMVHNIWRMKDNGSAVTYRREVAVNDAEVELTVQFRMPSYFQRPKDTPDTYAFSVPIKALEGMSFQAMTGRSYELRTVTGQIAANMPDGPIAETSFIAFRDNDRQLVFDFNPKGMSAFNDGSSYSALVARWAIIKDADQLRFYFGRSPTIYGGVFNSKVRILEGSFSDYSKWHAHSSYIYFGEVPTIGAPQLMPAGSGDKTLEVNVPQPGIYLFTIRNNLSKTGPFTLDCDGQTVARDVTSAKGDMNTITFSRYTQERKIKLAWHGRWAASTVAVQALIYKAEDFAFMRGVWLADDIPTPADFFMFKRTLPPASGWVVDGQSPELPYAPARLAAAKLPADEVNVPSPDDPNRQWRWDGSIVGFGADNMGSFHEYETDEQINLRLDELQRMGSRIIMLNGLFTRHCWLDQLPRIERTMARITELAHQRGMKVVDHQDLSIVAYQDEGFNQLLEHLDWTQRDVRTGVPTRGWCFNNPDFSNHYFEYISNWVKKTGIDGVMIDETSFHGEMFCGCEACREQFHRESGFYLPYSGEDLLNRNSRIWKLWLSWRLKSVGDWHVELRKSLEKVNPNIVIMKYTTDYGMLSPSASLGNGDTLTNTARAVDFLGTETMSRNLWVTYRSNMAARAMFNSLRHAYGTPIFGLVYPISQPVFAYSGWIQNNMHAQMTWTEGNTARIEADSKRYLNWKDNMDVRQARPVAQTAVVLSLPSIDFPAYYGVRDGAGYGQGYAMTGVAEQLGDAHIPYQIILNRDLTPEKLKKFSLLILPSASSMSDAEITAIRGFLQDGGNVLSLGHSGILDQLGDVRKVWPIGSWLGLRFNGKMTDKAAVTSLFGPVIGPQPMEMSEPVIEITRDGRGGDAPEILAQAKVGDQSFIAIARGPVGKGTLVIATPRLGDMNVEMETTIDEPWTYQYNARMGALFDCLVRPLLGEHPVFEAIQIPREVRTTVYHQENAEHGTMTLVHLYNGTGVKIVKDQKVPRSPSADPFPSLKEDIVFEIALHRGGPVTAQVVSPDYTGVRKAMTDALDDNRYRVTVSSDALKAYSIVKIMIDGSK